MDRKEALAILSDGHTIISPEAAEEVCREVGVEFDRKRLVHRWHSDPLGTPKGLMMAPGREDTEGVYTLDLSAYVAGKMGVAGSAGFFIGRGFQARAYAEAITRELQRRAVIANALKSSAKAVFKLS